MFRHYHIILRERVINSLPSYTSILNAAIGNTIYSQAAFEILAYLSKVLITGSLRMTR